MKKYILTHYPLENFYDISIQTPEGVIPIAQTIYREKGWIFKDCHNNTFDLTGAEVYIDGVRVFTNSTLTDLDEAKKQIQREIDNINPDHYKAGKVEAIDALEAATVNKTGIEAVCTANVIKYLWRYEAKNGLEDVKKAKWYLQRLEEHLSKKGGQQ